MGSLGERANVPSPCNWSLQSNMAKPRQVQSGAYVGTLLSPQRRQTRLKQRFFQIPLKRTFFQCDLQGSPVFPVSLPPTPPPKCQRGVPTIRRGSEARTALPQLYWREGGGVLSFTVGVDFQVHTPLGAPLKAAVPQNRSGWGWEDEEATCRRRHARAGCQSPPPPRHRCLTRVSSPSSPSKGQNCISSKGAGPPRARVKGGRRYSSQF